MTFQSVKLERQTQQFPADKEESGRIPFYLLQNRNVRMDVWRNKSDSVAEYHQPRAIDMSHLQIIDIYISHYVFTNSVTNFQQLCDLFKHLIVLICESERKILMFTTNSGVIALHRVY